VIAFGRDPSVALADDGSTAITWVDASNNIHLRTYDDTGAQVTNITVAGAATVPAGKQHVLALVGGEIVIAWVADADPSAGLNQVVRYEVLAPGAAVGSFTVGPIQTVATDFPDDGAGLDFGMAALPDGGGFALSWNGLDAGHSAIFTSSFTAGGVAIDAKVFHGAADATGVATTGLIGDRLVAVYEDDSTPGDPSNISAQIFDTRTQPNGADILPPGPGEPPNPGLVLIGDPPAGGGGGGGGAAAGPPDVLVGTIGNDVIDGRLGADTLDGGLGNDVIVAGAGSDIIDGGGNTFVTAVGGTLADGTVLATGGDTVIFNGAFSNDGNDTNDDYSIIYTGPADGSGTFIVSDLRTGAPDGIDTIRHVEFFEFVTAEGVHETIRTSDLVGQAATITPVSGWGNDNTFDFLVEHSTLGQQSVPAATGSAEGGPTLAWISNDGVEAQFYTNLGEPQVAAAEVASRVVVNPDPTGKSNVLITDGIAGLAVAWQQDLGGGLSALKMRGLGAEGGVPFGEEVTVGDPAFNNHSLQIAGYTFPVGVQVPKPHGNTADTIDGVADGVNAVWVSSAPGDVSGFGQIMLQRYEIITDDLGTAVDMLAAGSDGQAEGHDLRTDADRAALEAAGALNDDPIVLAARGRDPQVTGLHTGETVVTWIDDSGHVQAQLFPRKAFPYRPTR
jgi:RTX calcium-binding nonapeptide repeat (4 copies)